MSGAVKLTQFFRRQTASPQDDKGLRALSHDEFKPAINNFPGQNESAIVSDTLMTAKDFRQLALSLAETEERTHMNHPDFRVAGKVFATLGYPDKMCGMVKLTPEEQHYFCKDDPEVFVPVKGAWGRRGATSVVLKAAKKDALRKAIQAAWRNVAPKRLMEK
jgi:hypothetical protein